MAVRRVDWDAAIYAGATGVLAVMVTVTAVDESHLRLTYSLASTVAGILALRTAVKGRWGVWSATGAYAAVFWLFHFGLIALIGFGLRDPSELPAFTRRWVESVTGGTAALVACCGLCSFVLGAHLVKRYPASLPSVGATPPPIPRSWRVGGSLIVIVTTLWWFSVVLVTGGPELFFGSYEAYLSATAPYASSIATIWFLLGLGAVLAATPRMSLVQMAAAASSLAFAVCALPLGLRGELLFPGVAVIVALTRQGVRISRLKTVLAALLLLLAINAIRQARVSGLLSTEFRELKAGVLDGVAEMGGSLHPVERVVAWANEGEPFIWGASYWAPFERPLSRILPGHALIDAEEDDRIMNVLVSHRVGYIGFSPIAEGYRNFGLAGVIGFMGLAGVVIGFIDRDTNHEPTALIATLFVPLLIQIRNSFVPIPSQVVSGMLILTVLSFVARMGNSRQARRERGGRKSAVVRPAHRSSRHRRAASYPVRPGAVEPSNLSLPGHED